MRSRLIAFSNWKISGDLLVGDITSILPLSGGSEGTMNAINGNTLLLVEDEAIIAMSEKKELEKRGYGVVVARTGEEAVENIEHTNGIDLILLDIDLGKGIDGTEAALQILRLRDVPIVFLSSHIEPDIVNRTENITSYGYVVKNSGITVLDASIKMAFKLFNARKQILETEIVQTVMIAKSKQAEKILGASELRYRRLFETARDGILILDAESGKIVDVNPFLVEMLGYSKEQFVEKTIWEIGIFKDIVTNRDNFVELQEKEYIRYEDMPLGTADGRSVQVEFVSNVYLVDKQKVIQCNIRDITDRKIAEEKAKRLVREKELILKEVHHRIKNNMYTISTLLSLQAQTLDNPAAKAALADAESRVQSMMVLYDKLYQSENCSSASVVEYLSSLVDEILVNFPARDFIRIEKTIDDFELDAEKLYPLGIILNELITNIMKHAFTGRRDGLIAIAATLDGSRVSIGILDNGNGIPDGIDFPNSTGFGLTLVRELTIQLGGTIRMERGIGTKIVLEFER
jgi:PAS domain S-box-containing protein